VVVGDRRWREGVREPSGNEMTAHLPGRVAETFRPLARRLQVGQLWWVISRVEIDRGQHRDGIFRRVWRVQVSEDRSHYIYSFRETDHVYCFSFAYYSVIMRDRSCLYI